MKSRNQKEEDDKNVCAWNDSFAYIRTHYPPPI